MKVTVEYDLLYSIPNSLEKLQEGAKELSKHEFDHPYVVKLAFTHEGYHAYGDIPAIVKDRLNDILNAL